MTSWDNPKVRHVLINSPGGVFFDDIEAVSDQFILGKLKSPSNNIGLFGWVVLSWFKFS